MKPSPELAFLIGLLADIAHLPARTHASPGDGLDWTRFLAMVDEHKLGPLLGSRVTDFPAWNLPDATRSDLAHRFNRSSFAALVRHTEFARLMTRFSDGGVQVLALKGAALVPGLYPVAAERAMWDIDLLCADDTALRQATDILTGEGYRPRPQQDSHHHAPPLVNPVNELAFELHTNLITPPLPRSLIQDVWQRRVMRTLAPGLDIAVPDPVCLLAHQCIHALNDPVRSPLLRHVFEIAWLLSLMTTRQQADFVTWAARWSLQAKLAQAIHLAAELFGTPELFPRPPAGAYLFWCRSRLDWSEYGRWWARLQRHLASSHVERLLAGSHDRNFLTVLNIVTRSARDAVWSRLRPRFAWTVTRPARPDWPSAVIEDMVLIHNNETGEVHLLNDLAAQAWRLADGRTTVDELARRFTSPSGHAQGRAAVQALIGRGLLLRSQGTPD